MTWTVDEAHALSRVLTPGLDSQTDWLPYTENYAAISADMRAGCPATEYKRLGLYWTTKIGSRTVTVVKSDSHMSQDGPKLPNQQVWAQMIADTKPQWVISTGTGGGIGADTMVGDVLVSPRCRAQTRGWSATVRPSPPPAVEQVLGGIGTRSAAPTAIANSPTPSSAPATPSPFGSDRTLTGNSMFGNHKSALGEFTGRIAGAARWVDRQIGGTGQVPPGGDTAIRAPLTLSADA